MSICEQPQLALRELVRFILSQILNHSLGTPFCVSSFNRVRPSGGGFGSIAVYNS